MLSKYGMAGCKPISVPLDQNGKLSAHSSDVLEDATMYRKIVGSLIYMTITRPNMNYTVGLESQLYPSFLETTFRWCAVHTMLCQVHIGLCTLLYG